MKQITFIAALFAAIASTGCGSSSSEESATPSTTNSTTPATNTAPAPAANTTPVTQPAEQTLPAPTIAAPVVPQSKAPVTAAAGLNPEHGKPGHRCDIAVGAPLNSTPTVPPAAATSSKQVAAPQPTIVKQTSIPVPAVGAGLNPEHGKPGHRCDIAVGAPLNSKPAAQPAIVSNPQPVVKQTPTTLTVPPVVTGGTAAGMNPEHGKPGHRCDIAVGAPLNSKPAQ